MLVVCDAEGCVIWRDGDPRMVSEAARHGFDLGSEWAENSTGTGGIKLIANPTGARPRAVHVCGAEHWVGFQHKWACTSLANSIDRTLRVPLYRELSELRTAAQPALRAGSTTLAVTANGLIADWRDWDPRGRNRIALPDPVDGLTFVPALGFSDMEPLASGWLVRPRAGQEPVRVVLDLRARPRIRVAWSTGTWEHPITRQRFVDVLRVLPHGGQPGLTMDELRAKLPGDPGGKSNVYKIMSLLRREFGGLLDPGAYRFAGHVTAEVLH